MGRLNGRVVLITGAGGGIGRSHALACARAGASVVVNDLGGARDGTGADEGPADRVVAEIRALGGQAVANRDSVTDPDGCARMVQLALDTWGRLDGVVNNAGILRDRTFAKLVREDWDRVLDVHLNGTRNVVAAALPAFGTEGGAIVNTTSVSGLIGNFGQSNYAAAKAGIYGLSRVLALELAKRRITVNCVAPVAKTRMTEELASVQGDWLPEHISPLVVYLLSDLAKDVTGKVFGVQGQRIHAYEMGVGAGVEKPGSEPWTIDEIHTRLPDILAPEPRPATPVGKRYDGGQHEAIRTEFLAYAAATDDPNPAYGDIAPPMYHVRPLMPLMSALAADPELDLDRLRLVHGEHAATFYRPLRDGDRLDLSARLLSLEDKPSGRVATFGLYIHVAGALAVEATTTYFVRAKQTDAAPREKAARAPEAAPPEPTWTGPQAVALDQPVRYADASGDHNPIHLDPAVAQAAGLPGVILHGLCTMAFAQRDLVRTVCGGDPLRLRALSVRFARPVLPGQQLALSVWDDGTGDVRFATTDDQGRAVIANGRARVLST